MSISIVQPPENELLKAALDLLKHKGGYSERQSTRKEIEKICADFATSLEEASASPGIKNARGALRKMADDAAALASAFRKDDGRFMLGAATFSWADTPEQSAERRQEIEDFQEYLLPAAAELDRIAKRLRARIAQWESKRTGELHAYENVFGAPKKQLSKAAAKLFHEHRPNDLNAGRKSDFYDFLELLFEYATDKEPDGDELLRHAQEAVRAIRRKP